MKNNYLLTWTLSGRVETYVPFLFQGTFNENGFFFAHGPNFVLIFINEMQIWNEK
jgi:hypothetical protein